MKLGGFSARCNHRNDGKKNAIMFADFHDGCWLVARQSDLFNENGGSV